MSTLRIAIAFLFTSCAGNPLTEIPERESAAFRRCWPSIRVQYCQGIPDHQCIDDGAWVYRNTAPPRSRWLAVQGCPEAVIEDRPTAPSPPPSPPPPPSSEQCAPPCRASFVCVQGQCVSACNPPCPEGQTCTEGGTCVAVPGAVSP